MDDTAESQTQRTWLLLIHQLPAEPAYLRVKVSRRLKGVGAAALKNSVYVLPATESAREDFSWIVREIGAGGGDATLAETRLLEGVSDAEVEALLQSERAAEYEALAAEAESLPAPTPADAQRLRRRLGEIVARDHLESPSRAAAEHALGVLDARLRGGARAEPGAGVGEAPGGATWVTRRGVFVDRMASAWLIRRFIDGGARFRFVDPEDRAARAGEIRFDMFEGGYTHEADRCTFETLLARFGLADAALRAIGEVVHDIDCKDGRFGRPETAGVAGLIDGIARRHAGDEARVEAGVHVWESLYAHFGGRT